jgi:hypothetical protein
VQRDTIGVLNTTRDEPVTMSDCMMVRVLCERSHVHKRVSWSKAAGGADGQRRACTHGKAIQLHVLPIDARNRRGTNPLVV